MTDDRQPDMGVTGNAILLLGYIGGAIYDLYWPESVDAEAGTQVMRHRVTGNLFSIEVRQIDGVE